MASSVTAATSDMTLLSLASLSCGLLIRSFQRCALAMLHSRRPAMALGYALLALHTAPSCVDAHALCVAAEACAMLHVPQAAMHFIAQVSCIRLGS